MEKNKGMMMIIVIMLAIIIVTIIGGVIFLFISMNADAPEPEIILVTQPTEVDIRIFELGDSIQTNLLPIPGGGSHFARLDGVGIGINNTNVEAADEFFQILADREVVIRDRINGILRNTTHAELTAENGRENLIETIHQALLDIFNNPIIVRVYLELVTM